MKEASILTAEQLLSAIESPQTGSYPMRARPSIPPTPSAPIHPAPSEFQQFIQQSRQRAMQERDTPLRRITTSAGGVRG